MANIPEGMSEEEVVEVIDRVVRRLAWKYRFGYHTVDDIKQQGWVEALKGLDKYDNKRPLENFLWTHVRNRLFNFKRNNYERPDLPCKDCPLKAYDPACENSTSACTAYEDKQECSLYNNWSRRNAVKRNLMNPIELGGVADREREGNMKTWDKVEEKMDFQELIRIIETNIAIELKPDFIRIRYEIRIPKVRREKVLSAIRAILKEKGLDEQEAW